MNYAVETKDLTRIFRVKKRRRRRSGSKGAEQDVTALKDVNLRIEEGEARVAAEEVLGWYRDAKAKDPSL
ncbi:MAG: hypothetical protein LN409_02920, partial [Candidatus Thermoplasmatota archaeon]|nr:hypothetical protein [Candidatus Thermoplasmatota archaeon]